MWIPSAHHQQSPPHPGSTHGYKQKLSSSSAPSGPNPWGLPGFSPAFLTPKPRLCAVQEQEAEEVAAPAAYLGAGSKHAGVSAADDDDDGGGAGC